MRPSRFEGHPQRLARPEQMRLANHLIEMARPQALGQGGGGSGQHLRPPVARRAR